MNVIFIIAASWVPASVVAGVLIGKALKKLGKEPGP